MQGLAQIVARRGQKPRFGSVGDLQLPALLLKFIKQSCILDCDHRLVGKGSDEFNLLVVKRAHSGPAHQDHTDQVALAQKGHAKMRAKPAQCLGFAQGVVRVGKHIVDLDGLAFQLDAPNDAPSARRKRHGLYVFNVLGREAVARGAIVTYVFRAEVFREPCPRGKAAPPTRRAYQALSGVQGRAADDLEHICGGGLLLQRVAQLARKGSYLLFQLSMGLPRSVLS